MDNTEMLRKMRAGKFIKNNGLVLRAINILRHKPEHLEDVRYALASKMSETEYLDCINFLSEAGYILVRNIETKAPASISDFDYIYLEAKVSEKGLRLLGGEFIDKMIDA